MIWGMKIMGNWFEKVLSKEWDVIPAGGLTGDAYIANNGETRLFLKRNSSPFLAVLSAEGIVPKLVWTKRLANGDVITAQNWLDGRELEPEEMQSSTVADLLRKIHQSSELLHMLMRLGKKPISPLDRMNDIVNRLKILEIGNRPEVNIALKYIKELLPKEKDLQQVVCHCDLNHNNLLLSKTGKLYLIDWENAMIADPMTDYGMVLNSYIPRDNWKEWLANYGVNMNDTLMRNMYWHLLLDALNFLAWHAERKEENKVNERLLLLSKLNREVDEL